MNISWEGVVMAYCLSGLSRKDCREVVGELKGPIRVFLSEFSSQRVGGVMFVEPSWTRNNS